LVEDDTGIAMPLVRALEREGFEVAHLTSGLEAIEPSIWGGADLLLLDLTLPDLDGLEVCRRIRAQSATIPIVMLTARRSEIDIVTGFDAGADDYLGKPFSLAELLARVRARLRLGPSDVTPVVQSSGVTIDQAAHRVFIDGREIELTPKEYDLLVLLVSEAGRVVSRRRIMREIWNEQLQSNARTLDMHVSALRRKLDDDPAAPRYIATVRGVGLRFETPETGRPHGRSVSTGQG
jgi:DNA-binding response OmpR family regulator